MTENPERDRPLLIRGLLHVLTAVLGPLTPRNLLSWVLLLGGLFFIKGCVIDQYTIPSGSMEPTLTGQGKGIKDFFDDDRVLVNKWQFGPRVPFTTWRLWQWGGPKRWDIVVFRTVVPNSKHKTLIKRVVGLPGEKVQIKSRGLYIDGSLIEPPPELRDAIEYTDVLYATNEDIRRAFLRLAQTNEPHPFMNAANATVKTLYNDMERMHPKLAGMNLDSLSDTEVEVLCEGVDPVGLNVVRQMFSFEHPPLCYGILDEPEFSTVPEGHYLLLGDNSPHSADGRVWGWVPHNHLLGRACAIWWPWNRRRDFSGFSHTWWGALLLYGIPALIVATEIRQFARDRRRRKHDTGE